MARANIKLIQAIKAAADKMNSEGTYQWGHMGACNCGHLAQQLTPYSKREIHEYAMRKSGDWSDQVDDYCSTSAMPMDEIISSMMDSGLERKDMIELERLQNHEVRRYLGKRGNRLNHNIKEDVILYMRTWAQLLEEQLISQVTLPKEIHNSREVLATV
ncbi:MAG: hypothetical protein ACI9C9_000005 [Marivirga sp.]|jgi:hypothetical protein